MASLFWLACTPAAAAELPPAADFFENPSFGGPVLSPNGRLLALRVAGKGTRERLAVLDIASNKASIVASFPEADVDDIRWVNNERLVFDTVDRLAPPGDREHGPGLYAVNRDGSGFLQLVSRTRDFDIGGHRPALPKYARLVTGLGLQDSDYVYVTIGRADEDGRWTSELIKLNTVTGKYSAVAGAPDNARFHMLDHDGKPRLLISEWQKKSTIHYLDPATSAWRALVTYDTYNARVGFTPVAFGPDGTLYANTRLGSNFSALYKVDLATGKLSGKPLMALDGYDWNSGLIMGQNSLLGMRYVTDTHGTHWLDAALAAVQKAVDAKLPDTVNLIRPPTRADTGQVLVTSFSDTVPAVYRLFDREKGTFIEIGKSHPNIDPARMGRQEMVRYKARDGLQIPAYLTLPPGAKRKNLPLVVLVHGGPFVRGGTWGWEADTQFLASRGYAVLEPEFRGSTGFGSQHYRAGWKQWGLAMQNDVADGAKWAIAEGIVDPKRICIAGASYGGYATLMGLINDPDLFKCGISWAGVSDLALLHSGHWSFESDMSDNYRAHGFPVLVGDPVADAAQFKATSPLAQAARLKQPLLLAHGSADKRVPIFHSTRFRDAVKPGNAQLEWIEYAEEGHGWSLPTTRIDFWTRVETFLDRHIGKP